MSACRSDVPETGRILHASAVAFDGAAVCILGKSGTGKSGLALQLMAYGARLVADDGCRVWRQEALLWVDAVGTISGLIEARGVGLLNAKPAGATRLALWVDLDQRETHRLPPQREKVCLGVSLPIVHNAAHPHFAAAILQYLRAGRQA